MEEDECRLISSREKPYQKLRLSNCEMPHSGNLVTSLSPGSGLTEGKETGAGGKKAKESLPAESE